MLSRPPNNRARSRMPSGAVVLHHQLHRVGLEDQRHTDAACLRRVLADVGQRLLGNAIDG